MNQRVLVQVALSIVCVFLLAGCGGKQAEPISAPTQAPALAAPTVAGSYERFDIDEDLFLRKIQEGVYIITHSFPWAGNSMIVEMADSTLVLVDTPYTPKATHAVLDWVQDQLGRREIVAINTGFHCDNLGGNSYLIEAGIPVYGADLTAELLEERGEQVRAQTLGWLEDPKYERYYQAYETLPYVPPDHLFPISEGLELQFGTEVVQVYYPGPSHAPDNVVVYFPKRKILFGVA